MRKLRLPLLILTSAVLAGVGGMLYVRFYELRGDDDPNFVYLLAIGIGTAIGVLADHRRHRLAIVLTAACCAAGAGMFGCVQVAYLQYGANSGEFDLEALEEPEFFIALEAYKARSAGDVSAPPFTRVAERSHYSDEEWATGQHEWESRSEAEQLAIQAEWRSIYEQLNSLDGFWLVFSAPWSLYFYLPSAIIASGIVLAIQHAERRASRT